MLIDFIKHMCYICMSFLWNPPEKVVPYVRGKYNDGHCYDHHDYIGHIPGLVVVVFTRQDVGSRTSDPSCDGGNNIGGRNHSLRGDFTSSITLASISGSFYSDYYIIHCMRVSACRRT